MSIAKEKSPKPAAQAPSASTEQIAEQFCEEMIQNLKQNVAENKRRTDAKCRAVVDGFSTH
jgi:hypothetical protein